MTENKRYFKRMWEEEYYIFDSETISEKEFDEKVEYEDYRAFEDSMQGDEVVNRLNGLDGTIKDLSDDYEQLLKENKELKKTVSYFAEVCACSIEVMNEDENLKKVHSAIICTEMQELLKENKELKNEIKMLKTIIGKNEYYIGNITHKGKWR